MVGILHTEKELEKKTSKRKKVICECVGNRKSKINTILQLKNISLSFLLKDQMPQTWQLICSTESAVLQDRLLVSSGLPAVLSFLQQSCEISQLLSTTFTPGSKLFQTHLQLHPQENCLGGVLARTAQPKTQQSSRLLVQYESMLFMCLFHDNLHLCNSVLSLHWDFCCFSTRAG